MTQEARTGAETAAETGAFAGFKERLRLKGANVAERPIIYVAFGDSVTQGWFEHATFEPNCAFPALLKRLIERRYPYAEVNLINSGVSGDVAVRSMNRIERDLLPFRADLVTISFGVNDAHGGVAGLEPFKQAVAEMIRLLREQGTNDIVLLTPSGMMTSDNPYIHENEKRHVDAFRRVAEAGHWSAYRQAVLDVGQASGTACLDVSGMWLELGQSGEDLHAHLANGINHPDRAFHADVAAALDRFIFG